ncbi:MAG: MarR family transcriptional regulator [Gemmataceae bacterium]
MTHSPLVALALRKAYLALHRRTDRAFEPFGITADQFVLLTSLVREGDAITQNELARRISSDPSTIRAMLVLLEKQGLVRRESHPIDARSRSVRLTAKGIKLQRRMWDVSEPIRQSIHSALEHDESETLVRCLLRVERALESQQLSAVKQNLIPKHGVSP